MAGSNRTRLRHGGIAASPLDESRADYEPRSDGSFAESGWAGAALATLFQSLECGIVFFGSNGDIFETNARFAEIFELSPAEVSDLKSQEDLFAALSPCLLDPSAAIGNWRKGSMSEDGAWEDMQLVAPQWKLVARFTRAVRNAAGDRIGWFEMYYDLARDRILEQRLLHSQRITAVGQMMSGIAHELNSPLTSILGYAQLLMRRSRGVKWNSDLRCILEQAERASRIAKNLLLFVRDSPPEYSLLDINEVVKRAVALRIHELRLQGIAVELHLCTNPPAIQGDAAQIQQGLLNLLINAEQAILQTASSGSIRVSTQSLPGLLVIEVADSGPGIRPEIASRIFDPFFTTKSPGAGTGLGLSILCGIIRQHGGNVFLENQSAAGAAFRIELPAASSSVLSQAQRDVGHGGEQGPAIRSTQRCARILVVEDEPTVAQLVADVMTEEGHSADTVLDSRDALALIRLRTYDLIICDLRMPYFDGQRLYDELIEMRSPLARHIIFVTGDMLGPSTADFLHRSAVPCLAKPFLVEELKQIVHNALADRALEIPQKKARVWPHPRQKRT